MYLIMKLVSNFTELNKNNANLAGGKGASLGEMTQASIPVPPGFVILSDSFEQFLRETDLVQEIDNILSKVNHKEIHTVESASEQIKGLILSREMPTGIATEVKKHFDKLDSEYVAVRSSATAEDGAEHAWAGQLESYLNTTEADLLDKVKHCWASLFTPRAIFYRFEKGLHSTKISVAVVVQKMVNSELSGIAFSVHPITEDYNQLIIEAGFGLGEAIVSGSITPDSYVVEKEPRQIIDINVNNQKKGLYRKQSGGNEWKDIPEPKGTSQVLSKQQILDLSEIILNIESHYGFPCDIEWAYEDRKFYVVQSRPITTLSGKKKIYQQVFVKAYTRNFSIIMQQAWFAANKENLIQKLNLKDYPYNPPYLYFMKDGVEEVWENTKANRWLLDRLIEKLKSDKNFFLNIHKSYFDRLPKVEKWWSKEIKTIDELKEFIDLVYQGVSDFVILYAALMDEAVPKEYQDLASKFREKDVFFAECNTAIWKGLNNIYPELGYLAVYLTKEELGKDIDKNELIKRDAGFALIPDIFVGPISFEELINKFPEYLFKIEKGEQDSGGLRGQIGYKGKVRGIVRIIKRKDQVEQMQEGEIIVSPMTTPDMVPAMKKATAFVTDEGGITCHAAIIAREMKKPCIIGTKVATQIFKDGDEIEVDADNGLVRILSQHSGNIELSKVFSREKTLFYFSMWNDSDIMGWKNFLEYDVKNNLFIVPPSGQKGSVWYSQKELDQIDAILKEKIKNDKNLIPSFQKTLDENWAIIFPYLSDEKKILSIDEFENYYNHLVGWWSAMNTAFGIPDMENISKEVRDVFLSYRTESEKFTEKMNKVLVSFWNEHFPELHDLTFFVAPNEIRSISSKSEQVISRVRERSEGCFMLNEKIYPMKDLENKLQEFGLYLEKVLIENSEEIKGNPAYKGKVYGKVRKISSFKDMKNIKQGEVLVTEMTNPDYLPIMKIASAVVTDEGGATCHAAIACRELKIPCIVGTKNSTQILQDGMEVEVDADNGIIKIISNKEFNPSDYIRMFAGKSFPYLFSNVFLGYYNSLGVVSIQGDGTWMSFFPKSLVEKTNQEGKELYTSEIVYKKYKTEFDNYINTSRKYFELAVKKEVVNFEDVRQFFQHVSNLFAYYSKTEFFYTDAVDQTKMAITVKEFDELKLGGRAYLNSLFFESEGFIKSFVRNIAKQTNTKEDDLLNYSVEELINLVENKNKIFSEEVKTRDIFFESKDKILFGSSAKNLIDDFFSNYLQISDVIKGTIANKGRAKGKARVLVPDAKDFDKIAHAVKEMKEGEILIAETTSPDIIAACKKAAAIVTNQGGQLSHAAIVSRELGIPCVIGTDKDVILNIKNGDTVEVNADEGIIHIIK